MYITDVPIGGKSGSDVIQTYGLNMNDLTSVPATDGVYIRKLYEAGALGPGKEIDSAPLPMEKFGSAAFTEALCKAIVNREGIGADLADGLMRAARKWGRLEQDLATGLLGKPHWGYTWHWSLPYVEQAYGSLMGDREVTEHAFSSLRAQVAMDIMERNKFPAEKLVEMLSRKLVPYAGDPFMLDYSWQGVDGSKMDQALSTGIYSKHKAKFVAWHRHYTRFWAESILYCDVIWPSFFHESAPAFGGFTPESEPRFLNAVTGKNLTFADGMEIGRKIWNLNRAIWVLQGRHRDMENFAGFMYTPAGSLAKYFQAFGDIANPAMPVYENGKWTATRLEDLYLDKSGVEQWKTHFYEFEGWDPNTGWPTRNTLEELGLKGVADALQSVGRLGSRR
jgi:aldehyde:ferredoxin oxidoreductase